MVVILPLAIVDGNSKTIVLVNAPFALRRGGASPVALVCLFDDNNLQANIQ